MKKATSRTAKAKSTRRAKSPTLKDLAPRKTVKGGGINRIVVTDGNIKASM